jgi:hypothetical protein
MTCIYPRMCHPLVCASWWHTWCLWVRTLQQSVAWSLVQLWSMLWLGGWVFVGSEWQGGRWALFLSKALCVCVCALGVLGDCQLCRQNTTTECWPGRLNLLLRGRGSRGIRSCTVWTSRLTPLCHTRSCCVYSAGNGGMVICSQKFTPSCVDTAACCQHCSGQPLSVHWQALRALALPRVFRDTLLQRRAGVLLCGGLDSHPRCRRHTPWQLLLPRYNHL